MHTTIALNVAGQGPPRAPAASLAAWLLLASGSAWRVAWDDSTGGVSVTLPQDHVPALAAAVAAWHGAPPQPFVVPPGPLGQPAPPGPVLDPGDSWARE